MPNEATGASSAAKAGEGTITIRSGIHVREVPINGMTINQIKEQYTPLYRIPADASPWCGTQKLDGNTVPEPGMTIEFAKKGGEKG